MGKMKKFWITLTPLSDELHIDDEDVIDENQNSIIENFLSSYLGNLDLKKEHAEHSDNESSQYSSEEDDNDCCIIDIRRMNSSSENENNILVEYESDDESFEIGEWSSSFYVRSRKKSRRLLRSFRRSSQKSLPRASRNNSIESWEMNF